MALPKKITSSRLPISTPQLKKLSLITAACLLPCLLALPSYASMKDYRNFDSVEKQLLSLSAQYPQKIKLEQIGKSAGGKPLYFIQIANNGSIPAAKRPALFVGANIAGFHHTGTEAAMHLIETLASSNDQKMNAMLSTKTIYVAPILNPDAHNALFASVRSLRAGNQTKLDRDLDGLLNEDAPDDLDGNGVITMMRIKDTNGDMVVDPDNPRRMMKVDPTKNERGSYRLSLEGNDDDKDGVYNEDGVGGVHPDSNFAAGFLVANAQSGLWPGVIPETKSIMDAILKHKNIAMAVIYGPANQLLSAPKGFDRSTPAGAKPSNEAHRFEADDLKTLADLGEHYKKSLDKAGLDNKRAGKQTGAGSFANWLYFHYGVTTVELDVWGIPKMKAPAKTNDQNTAVPELAASQNNIARLANTATSPNPTKTPNTPNTSSQNSANEANSEKDLYAYIDAHSPQSYTPWKQMKLANGEIAEVGGVDPFIEFTPAKQLLAPALEVHTKQVIEWVDKLAQLEIIDTQVTHKGNDVWLITAVGGMKGEIATHSKLAARMKNKIPVRLEMKLGKDVTSITLNKAVTVERLEPSSTIKGEWLVKGAAGSTVDIGLWTNHAGQVRSTVTLGKGK